MILAGGGERQRWDMVRLYNKGYKCYLMYLRADHVGTFEKLYQTRIQEHRYSFEDYSFETVNSSEILSLR